MIKYIPPGNGSDRKKPFATMVGFGQNTHPRQEVKSPFEEDADDEDKVILKMQKRSKKILGKRLGF